VRLLAAALAGLALAAPAFASEQHPTLAELEPQVMCLVCHETLDQSNSPFATRVKTFIQRRIDAGDTAGEIKAKLVKQFGEAILAAPPRKGFDLLAWWLPLGGIVAAALLVAFGVWRWSRGRPHDDDPELDVETEQRLDELLARLD
jgi:cytochrome c-type biogenesis protein CcmH